MTAGDVVRIGRRAPDDPLGPIAQDPDGPRDLACDLTAADSVCTPTTVELRDPPNFSGGSGAASGLGNLLVVLLVLALVAAIVWIIVTLIRRRGEIADDEPDDLDEELDGELGERIIDETRPPDRWRDAAASHRAAGRHRDAIRCQYRALVGDLARAGVVDEIPGRTSGEERLQLAELAPDVSPAFDEAAELFDEAWFDDGEVTAAQDDRFRAAEAFVLGHVLGSGGNGRRRSRAVVGR